MNGGESPNRLLIALSNINLQILSLSLMCFSVQLVLVSLHENRYENFCSNVYTDGQTLLVYRKIIKMGKKYLENYTNNQLT